METNYIVEHPSIQDANAMWELACRGDLDTNSSYSYLMMAKFFRDRCFVLKYEDRVIGFMTGFILKDDIYFVWQICISDEYQGLGLSKLLLKEAISKLLDKHKIKFVQATITPDNIASMSLFKHLTGSYKTFFAIKDGFSEDHFPDDKPEEKLIQVGPLDIGY